MFILGIHNGEHDASACLFDDFGRGGRRKVNGRAVLPRGGKRRDATQFVVPISGRIARLALLAELSEEELTRLDNARPEALRVRAPRPARPLVRHTLPGGRATIDPPGLREKLFRAAQLTRAATRPDGRVVQVGDTDSGRLFKLTPAGRNDGPTGDLAFCEDALDHRSTAGAIEAPFGVEGPVKALDAIVVGRLAGGSSFPMPLISPIDQHGGVDAVIAGIEALPPVCRRCRRIPFIKPLAIDAWRRSAFPDFGLYTFAADHAFVAFRCAPRPRPAAPLGHRHDDNLAVEYVLGTEHRIDPGTFCYTPSHALRDRYRGAGAHDVVRALDWDVAPAGADMFHLEHLAWANCIAWGLDGVAGEIVAPRGRLVRVLRLTEGALEIWDGVDAANRLREISTPIEVAAGYGLLERARAS